jgi:geranylgeranylglycerol-phosphate geranylgeranyltransferase
MATILVGHERQNLQQRNEARAQASFFRSQLILFNSRKKHGLLYSVATAAGLFCIPGILGVMGSESEIQLLIQRTIPLPFITLMITVGMFILNDLVDVDLDKANSKNRPISSGLVSKKQAWSFIILTNGAAVGMLTLIVTLNLANTILVVPMILIGILYSMPKKIAFMNRFLLKNIAISLFYVLCIMLGISSSYGIELAMNNPVGPIHIMAISGIMIFVGSIINDLGDTKGDRAAGRRTIPIVLGGEKTIKMLILLLGSMPVISWMLYGTFLGHDTISMMTPIAVTIVASLAVFRMTSIWKVFESMKLMREQHKKWFPLYIVLQAGIVVGSNLHL